METMGRTAPSPTSAYRPARRGNRVLQEWMGHRDFKTTLIYADYEPGEHEAELIERAFGRERGATASKTE
jgi:hypothetical protein